MCLAVVAFDAITCLKFNILEGVRTTLPYNYTAFLLEGIISVAIKYTKYL